MELARPRTFGNARIAALVEVASRCEKEIDLNCPPPFDLAAEEMEKENPDLVIRVLTAGRCNKLRGRARGPYSSAKNRLREVEMGCNTVALAQHWLREHRIYTVGRFGEWAYINSDEALYRGHCVGMKLAVGEGIQCGAPPRQPAAVVR